MQIMKIDFEHKRGWDTANCSIDVKEDGGITLTSNILIHNYVVEFDKNFLITTIKRTGVNEKDGLNYTEKYGERMANKKPIIVKTYTNSDNEILYATGRSPDLQEYDKKRFAITPGGLGNQYAILEAGLKSLPEGEQKTELLAGFKKAAREMGYRAKQINYIKSH